MQRSFVGALNTEMDSCGTDLAPNLRQIVWACHHYWQNEFLSPADRVVCYKWVARRHRDRFGTNFHQSALDRLAKLGFLGKDDTSRGGNRRYYKLTRPADIERLLIQWRLN